MATACVLFHRFFYSKSFVRYSMEHSAIATVCLGTSIFCLLRGVLIMCSNDYIMQKVYFLRLMVLTNEKSGDLKVVGWGWGLQQNV
jgi:hypothetical protein